MNTKMLIWLGNASVVLHAKRTKRLQRDTIVVENIGTHRSFLERSGTSVLISTDPLPSTGGPIA